jgi:hypothetical protein
MLNGASLHRIRCRPAHVTTGIAGSTVIAMFPVAVLPSENVADKGEHGPLQKHPILKIRRRFGITPSATARFTASLLPFTNAPSHHWPLPTSKPVFSSVFHTPPALFINHSCVTVRCRSGVQRHHRVPSTVRPDCALIVLPTVGADKIVA